MRRYWLEGSLEVGLVGDFKPEEIQALAATNLGTLSRRRPKAAITSAERLQFGSSTGKLIVRAKIPAGAAATFLAWPVALADDPKNSRALQLAADVLMDRMRVKLREELGATYSPHASLTRNRQQPDYAFLWAGATFDPKLASALTERVIALAGDLTQHGATAKTR